MGLREAAIIWGSAALSITTANDGTISRFGWKAQNKSLMIFAGEAYNVEMGISTNCLRKIGRCRAQDQLGSGLPANCLNLAGTGTPRGHYTLRWHKASTVTSDSGCSCLHAVPGPATPSTTSREEQPRSPMAQAL